MTKINFQNNITKCNADTFNTMQDNIEDSINNINTTISNYESSGSGTRSSSLTNGTLNWFKIGKFCFITIADLYGNNEAMSTDGTIIFSDIPKAKYTKVFILQSFSTFDQVRVRTQTNGTIALHWSTFPVSSSSKQFYGFFVYELE